MVLLMLRVCDFDDEVVGGVRCVLLLMWRVYDIGDEVVVSLARKTGMRWGSEEQREC